MSELLGRTNRVFPRLWWRLLGCDEENRLQICEYLRSNPGVVMASPLWAAELRDAKCDWVVCGGSKVGNSQSQEQAMNQMTGEIIASVAGSPDGFVSIYFLSVARAWEEHQINGALAALQSAKEEGLIGSIGLHVAGSALGVASLWRFHDAFEVVLVAHNPRTEKDYQSVVATALDRRVGVVQESVFDWGGGVPFFAMPNIDWKLGSALLADRLRVNPVLLGVASVREMEMATQAAQDSSKLGIDLESLWKAYKNPYSWHEPLERPDWEVARQKYIKDLDGH
ncbi:MAG: hypothetical protein KF824_01225 [Fimbriimonadaceae bacterium]|nr:MAG: hypothetical protein KF824_01225 [Fimbriimonadaceae bacterium]